MMPPEDAFGFGQIYDGDKPLRVRAVHSANYESLLHVLSMGIEQIQYDADTIKVMTIDEKKHAVKVLSNAQRIARGNGSFYELMMYALMEMHYGGKGGMVGGRSVMGVLEGIFPRAKNARLIATPGDDEDAKQAQADKESEFLD